MSETPFAVTDSAAKRSAFLASREAKPVMMRVAVLGGGCSGFQYNFSFEEQKNDDDLLIERDGAAVVVDSTSLELLKGGATECAEKRAGPASKVKTRTAAPSCGCGTSFSFGRAPPCRSHAVG